MTEALPPPPSPSSSEATNLDLTLLAPPVLRCPRCGRGDVTLEPRHGMLDRLAALAFWRPLLCGGCRRRFRRFVPRSELARRRAASSAA